MLAVALRLEHLVVLTGPAVLALYVEMSLSDFALLSLAAIAWQKFYALLMRYFKRRLEPPVHWLGGDRGRDGAAAAWEVARRAHLFDRVLEGRRYSAPAATH